MSLPLLLERRAPGKGPLVPIPEAFDCLVVEGLASGCKITVDTGTSKIVVVEDCKVAISKTVPGFVAQAELHQQGSCVHVWLEKSNG